MTTLSELIPGDMDCARTSTSDDIVPHFWRYENGNGSGTSALGLIYVALWNLESNISISFHFGCSVSAAVKPTQPDYDTRRTMGERQGSTRHTSS